MLVSHKYKFVYLKNVKVAGSSVEHVFQKYCVKDEFKKKLEKRKKDKVEQFISKNGIVSGRKNGGKYPPHMSAKQVRRVIGSSFDDYFKFSVIRNPFDKIVSLFWHLNFSSLKKVDRDNFKLIKKRFNKFVSSNIKNSRDWHIHSIGNAPICNFYIRYESLDAGVAHVLNELGINEEFCLPKFKSGFRSRMIDYDYKDYYTKGSISIVKRVYKKEIDFFKYKFDN